MDTTQIVPFELMAAIGGLLVFDKHIGTDVRVLHFIDSMSALNVVLKGASSQSDLNSLVGSLWYMMRSRSATYWARRVSSDLNLADGPSRTWRMAPQEGSLV